MPKVLFVEGFSFFFYANEAGHEPHVHVEKGGASGKWGLGPVMQIGFTTFKSAQAKRVQELVVEHEAEIHAAWTAFFSPESNS